MMFIIVAGFIVTARAQRPDYLKESTYPKLAARFRNDADDAAAVTNINNRLGEIDGTTEKIPIDARGDVHLVNRFKEWPRQNIPYWVLNADHIERQRNPQLNQISSVSGIQQNRIPQQNNNQRRPLIQPQNIRGRFDEDDFNSRSSFESDESYRVVDSGFRRPVPPLQRRPFFAGRL